MNQQCLNNKSLRAAYMVAACFMLLVCASLFSRQTLADERIEFKDDVQKSQYLELVAELRCPKCQNQNIADSNAVIARDMRRKTKELLDEGYTRQEVINYMVDRYGQFAHYQPPMNLATSLLWFLPALFIVFGVFMLVRRTRSVDSAASEPNTHATASTSSEIASSAQAIAADKLDSDLEALLEATDENNVNPIETKQNSSNQNSTKQNEANK